MNDNEAIIEELKVLNGELKNKLERIECKAREAEDALRIIIQEC